MFGHFSLLGLIDFLFNGAASGGGGAYVPTYYIYGF